MAGEDAGPALPLPTAPPAPPLTPSLEVISFGCRLNGLDGEKVRRAATASGLQRTVIVNSCGVTQEAVSKARQAIRAAKRRDPSVRVVVTGCAAQIEPETFARMGEVDLVLGNAAKAAPETWDAARAALDAGLPTAQRVRVSDIFAARETTPHLSAAVEGRTRAFIEVQNGCDHRCTFCVIPFGRGGSRSVPMGEAVAEVRRLVEAGHKEVVLTGVDLTSYGTGLPDGATLGRLVRAILSGVPELPRLRLSSIDAVEADGDLLAAFAEEERLMPHLHLSLQSGDDLILKRMKRRHSRAQALALLERLRRLRPDLAFGADIIAGFPTETEAQARATLDFVEAAGLAYVHVFPFSARTGTPAARMPQVPAAEVGARARRLRAKGLSLLRRHLARAVGRQRTVLAEKDGHGYTEQFTPVSLPQRLAAGSLAPVRIIGHDGTRLIAV